MRLVNTTAVPAEVRTVERGPQRLALLTAKATFGFDGELDSQHPVALFEQDEPTAHGLLPADSHARCDAAFEVIVLGRAHAPGGRPVPRCFVSLSVGEETRHLHVSGDRTFRGRVPGEPLPFETMPLTYDRAFGGRCDVYLDAASPLEVAHPLNPDGRGFDPAPLAAGLGRYLGLPPGLPHVRYARELPNVEDPRALISNPEDAPVPASWATVPRGFGLASLRAGRGEVSLPNALAYRAHPTWIVRRPANGSTLRLTGLGPNGTEALACPQLRIFVDTEGGSRELCPQLLVLLPEERRLYLVYRALVPRAPAARLRLDAGWCEPSLRPS